MRIGKKSNFYATAKVVIRRPNPEDNIEFTARALPLDFIPIQGMILGNPPEPPLGDPVKGSDGKFQKDPETGKVMRERLTKNPDYVAASNAYTLSVLVLTFLWGIHDPAEFEFDCGPIPPRDNFDPQQIKEYVEKLKGELNRSGISFGDLVHVVKQIQDISNLGDEVGAAKDF